MTTKRKGCVVAVVLAVSVLVLTVFGFVRALTPRDVSKEKPEKVFRDFVCDPMPPSVSDLKAGGGIAFAGGNVVVDFTIEDRDRETLLRQGKFSTPDKHDAEWIAPNDPFGGEGGSTAFVRRVEGMSQIALYLAKNSNRARLQYISY